MSANQAVAEVDLSFIDEPLASDLARSLEVGLDAGAVFEDSGGPDDLFRAAVARAIRAIEAKDREGLLPRFLTRGPYCDGGEIPEGRRSEFLTDEEVAATIRFIHSSAINSFKGALAELLAVGPVHEVARRAHLHARVFCGDCVLARKPRSHGWGKAADFHLLGTTSDCTGSAALHGVVEVKSYPARPAPLELQVSQHIARARRGLRIRGRDVECRTPAIGAPVGISVVPSTWHLSREIRFEGDDRELLYQPEAIPPMGENHLERLSGDRWKVVLRWSQEALTSVAYEMTFWYMGELGQMLYPRGAPREWNEMMPEEAGRNAAKMMLYYAILRARTVREESRAIALYNAYGFGYALGANFVDQTGRREMLWFEDLRDIAATGRCLRRAVDTNNASALRSREVPAVRVCRIRP